MVIVAKFGFTYDYYITVFPYLDIFYLLKFEQLTQYIKLKAMWDQFEVMY